MVETQWCGTRRADVLRNADRYQRGRSPVVDSIVSLDGEPTTRVDRRQWAALVGGGRRFAVGQREVSIEDLEDLIGVLDHFADRASP